MRWGSGLWDAGFRAAVDETSGCLLLRSLSTVRQRKGYVQILKAFVGEKTASTTSMVTCSKPVLICGVEGILCNFNSAEDCKLFRTCICLVQSRSS